jgi:NAD(P)-dependent dehydrogenase (short-subunit alcohol dehydrogenase family)
MRQSGAPIAGNEANSWAGGRHFLITGASSGIGFHLARHFAGICRKLTLVSRNTNGRLDEAVGEVQNLAKRRLEGAIGIDTTVKFHQVDVRDKQSIQSLVREIYHDDRDQVDAFVNCAGGSHRFALLEHMTTDDIDEIIDVNGKAPIYWLRELLVLMKSNTIPSGYVKRGHIVMLSSRSGERPLPNLSVYAAAKACVENLLEAVRAEYACYKIAFTLVNPGSINTAFTQHWSPELQEMHNAESMSVTEAIAPIIHALNSQFVYNRISYESLAQWMGEPGVLRTPPLGSGDLSRNKKGKGSREDRVR